MVIQYPICLLHIVFFCQLCTSTALTVTALLHQLCSVNALTVAVRRANWGEILWIIGEENKLYHRKIILYQVIL